MVDMRSHSRPLTDFDDTEFDDDGRTEREREEHRRRTSSGKSCELCGEDLVWGADEVRVSIVFGVRGSNGIHVDFALGSSGDLLHQPLYLHKECWLDAVSDRFADVMGSAPSNEGSGPVLLECVICRSLVREEVDMFAMCQFGTLQPSKGSATFEPEETPPQGVCMDCISAIETDWFMEED